MLILRHQLVLFLECYRTDLLSVTVIYVLDLSLIGFLKLAYCLSVLPLFEQILLYFNIMSLNIFFCLRLQLIYQSLLHLNLRLKILDEILSLAFLVFKLDQLCLFLVQSLLHISHLLFTISYAIGFYNIFLRSSLQSVDLLLQYLNLILHSSLIQSWLSHSILVFTSFIVLTDLNFINCVFESVDGVICWVDLIDLVVIVKFQTCYLSLPFVQLLSHLLKLLFRYFRNIRIWPVSWCLKLYAQPPQFHIFILNLMFKYSYLALQTHHLLLSLVLPVIFTLTNLHLQVEYLLF